MEKERETKNNKTPPSLMPLFKLAMRPCISPPGPQYGLLIYSCHRFYGMVLIYPRAILDVGKVAFRFKKSEASARIHETILVACLRVMSVCHFAAGRRLIGTLYVWP